MHSPGIGLDFTGMCTLPLEQSELNTANYIKLFLYETICQSLQNYT